MFLLSVRAVSSEGCWILDGAISGSSEKVRRSYGADGYYTCSTDGYLVPVRDRIDYLYMFWNYWYKFESSGMTVSGSQKNVTYDDTLNNYVEIRGATSPMSYDVSGHVARVDSVSNSQAVFSQPPQTIRRGEEKNLVFEASLWEDTRPDNPNVVSGMSVRADIWCEPEFKGSYENWSEDDAWDKWNYAYDYDKTAGYFGICEPYDPSLCHWLGCSVLEYNYREDFPNEVTKSEGYSMANNCPPESLDVYDGSVLIISVEYGYRYINFFYRYSGSSAADVSGPYVSYTDASDKADEESFHIPPAVGIGIAIGGGGLLISRINKKRKKKNNPDSAGSSKDSRNNDRDDKDESESTYDLRVKKDFGDTLRKGEPQKVYARMVEILPDGREKIALSLTREIRIYSRDGLEISGTAMTGEYMSAIVSVPDAMKDRETASVIFDFAGVYVLNMRFKVETEAEPVSIIFPERKPSQSEMNLDLIAGDGGKYRVLFCFENTVREPLNISFFTEGRFDITGEQAEYEHSYYAVIQNRTAPIDYRPFYKPEYITVRINAEFENGSKAEGFFSVCVYPEGLNITCADSRQIEKERLVITAFEDENATEWDYKILPTVFNAVCAESETSNGVTTAKLLCGEQYHFKFSRLTGDAEYSDTFGKTFSWSIGRSREEDGIYEFVPGAVLAQGKDPYEADMYVSCTVDGGTYKQKLPLILYGKKAPVKPVSWEKELKNLKKDIQYFGLSKNEQIARAVRGARSLSADEICMLRRAIILEAMAYYTKEGQYFQSLEDSLRRYEFAFSVVKWIGDQAFTYVVISYCGGNPYPEAFITPLKDLVVDFLGQLWASSYWGEDISLSWESLGQTAVDSAERWLGYYLRDAIVSGNIKKVGYAAAYFMFGTWLDKYFWDEKSKGDAYKATLAAVNATFTASVKSLFYAKFTKLMKNDTGLKTGLEKFISDCLKKACPYIGSQLPGYDAAGETAHIIGIVTKYLTETVGLAITVFRDNVIKQVNNAETISGRLENMDIDKAEPGFNPAYYPDSTARAQAKANYIVWRSLAEMSEKGAFDIDLKVGDAVIRIDIFGNMKALGEYVWDISLGIIIPRCQRVEVKDCDEYMRKSEEVLGELKGRLDEKAENDYYRTRDNLITGGRKQ